MGRNFHLIATASKDQKVKIWKLTVQQEKQKIEAKEIASFDEHHAEVCQSDSKSSLISFYLGVAS
jgi:hypothetical protein